MFGAIVSTHVEDGDGEDIVVFGVYIPRQRENPLEDGTFMKVKSRECQQMCFQWASDYHEALAVTKSAKDVAPPGAPTPHSTRGDLCNIMKKWFSPGKPIMELIFKLLLLFVSVPLCAIISRLPSSVLAAAGVVVFASALEKCLEKWSEAE